MKANSTMKRKIHKVLRSKTFLIIMFFVGLLVLAYPLISDRYYTVQQKSAETAHEAYVKGLSPEEKKRILHEARVHNEKLYQLGTEIFNSLRLDFLEEELRTGTFPAFFLPDQTIGTVEIPKIDQKLPVYSGTSDAILEKGAGFMIPTSLPVGGPNTHSVITAHRGLPQSRLFRDLGELQKGDIFLVKVLDDTLAYKVTDIHVIKPTEVELLSIEPGKDRCTLLTCHPYMINSHRLIVRGERVDYNEKIIKEAEKQKDENKLRIFFTKYKEYFIGFGIFALFAALSVWREKRRRRKIRSVELTDETKKPKGGQ